MDVEVESLKTVAHDGIAQCMVSRHKSLLVILLDKIVLPLIDT